MTPREQKTEDTLRLRLARIAPPRALFSAVTSFVTESEQPRYTDTPRWRDGGYQFKILYFIHRSFVFGAAAVVFASGVGAWYVLSAGLPASVAVVPTSVLTEPTPAVVPAETAASLADIAAPTPVDTAILFDTSIETLGSDIETGGTADANAVVGESHESDTMNASLDNYSEVKTNSYDNTL